ncbi:reverse transcriptase [Gossypium australe]|uniref:Reverse transcriptase n=1 Tax=Gossypium australe TaxID=47621 RepID=A0A5B6VH82_9ROSI|nr:reverse transcriptase [Gossypium australe]
MEAIYIVMKDIGPAKATGADGLLTLFYQKYWHVVVHDVGQYCLSVLNGCNSLESISSTQIILLPKIAHSNSLLQFHPISLCTVLYKIIAKSVANRFKLVLENCSDKAQSAFVHGRLITDNMLLAYEILHEGLFALKLDMSKTYDCVEWNFLRAMMLKMGVVKWVDFYITVFHR